MKSIFYFGEQVKEFKVRVLNEREVRAAAGIVFLFAIIAFMNAWLTGNFDITRIFVIAFLVDFFIRIFINPKYAPSLILGRFFVRNQKPEYVGAPQKRFAWGIGFILATIMLLLIITGSAMGPVTLLICFTCLTFLFFETSFGICVGCGMYNLFNKEKAQLCPGGVCENVQKEEIQKIGPSQIIILFLFAALVISLSLFGMSTDSETEIDDTRVSNEEEIEDCEVPGWVDDLGHREKYILHNGCK